MAFVSADVQIIGIANLIKKMEGIGLPGPVRNRILKSSLVKGVAHTRKDMRLRAPLGPTGNLRKSIKSKVKVTQKRAWGRVKPRGDIAPHRHWIVSGTSVRFVKSTGQNVGKVPPNDFVTDSFDATAAEAGGIIAATADKLIKKAWSSG